ncbi:MAG: hypothetical protein AB1765_10760 [Candidatus Hydrogenedentota bacterium]
MFKKKIAISRDLYEKLKNLSNEKGYSSVEEMIIHLLEKEIEKNNKESKKTDEQLKGLGYL